MKNKNHFYIVEDFGSAIVECNGDCEFELEAIKAAFVKQNVSELRLIKASLERTGPSENEILGNVAPMPPI